MDSEQREATSAVEEERRGEGWRESWWRRVTCICKALRQNGDDELPDSEGHEHFRVQRRYLPIISGLVCPFSVLLDVGSLPLRRYSVELGC